MHKKKSASYFRGDLWYKEQVDRRTREALDRLQADFAREHGMDSTERLLQYLRAQDQALGPLASPGEVIGGPVLYERLGSWSKVLAQAGLPYPADRRDLSRSKLYRAEFKRQAAAFRAERKAIKAAKQERAQGKSST